MKLHWIEIQDVVCTQSNYFGDLGPVLAMKWTLIWMWILWRECRGMMKLSWLGKCSAKAAQHDRIAWRLGGWDLIQALQSLLPRVRKDCGMFPEQTCDFYILILHNTSVAKLQKNEKPNPAMTDLYGELSQWLTMTRLINRSPETAIWQEMLGWSGSLESPALKILTTTSKLPDTIAGREQQVLHAFFLTIVYIIYYIPYYTVLYIFISYWWSIEWLSVGGLKVASQKDIHYLSLPDDSRHEAPELCEMPHMRLIRLSLLWASLLPERGGYPGAVPKWSKALSKWNLDLFVASIIWNPLKSSEKRLVSPTCSLLIQVRWYEIDSGLMEGPLKIAPNPRWIKIPGPLRHHASQQ